MGNVDLMLGRLFHQPGADTFRDIVRLKNVGSLGRKDMLPCHGLRALPVLMIPITGGVYGEGSYSSTALLTFRHPSDIARKCQSNHSYYLFVSRRQYCHRF